MRERFPTTLPGMLGVLRKAAEEEGWNKGNLILAVCDKVGEMRVVLEYAYSMYVTYGGFCFTCDRMGASRAEVEHVPTCRMLPLQKVLYEKEEEGGEEGTNEDSQ